MKLALVVAAAQNGVIGRNNDLPWYLPEDLKRFKELTLNHPVIMGRKTFESIVARLGKSLPERTSIVVSHAMTKPEYANVLVAGSIDEALMIAQEYVGADETAFVIGGANIFEQTLASADVMYLTQIIGDVEGDVLFPKLDGTWVETDRSDVMTSKTGVKYSYVTYKR